MTDNAMKTSRRILFSWICLVTGFFALFLGIGPVIFVALVLAHCIFRYVLQPKIPSASFMRPWMIPIYLVLVVSLVVGPAVIAIRQPPDFEAIFQNSFGGLFRFFQWCGASCLLGIVLSDDLGRIYEERNNHVA